MSETEVQQCDNAEEEKKVPPDLESARPETPKQDAPQTPSKTSPFPVKSPQYLPLPNRPLQQPEPSAAVAAVSVTASAANPATVLASSHLGSSNPVSLPSSTSPAGGVPFPTSLLSQEEFPVSPTASTTSASKTVSPVLGAKSYDSAVKPHRGSNSDVVHSLAFPICSSYSDYTVNYATSQYSNNKHSYHNPEHRDSSQRAQYQKLTQSTYYHNSQQPVLDKYSTSKDSIPRTSSKEVIACDGYKTESFVDNRYENKSGVGNINYCVNQAYANEKVCDPQSVYKKNTSGNVYNFKPNELSTQNSTENIVKPSVEKSHTKIANDCYSNVNKTKVPNRTAYYQTIVNKSHSRHKSSRRVLPASAYENAKPGTNYVASKSDLVQGHANKSIHYAPYHYPSENRKNEYYQQPLNATSTSATNNYNCVPYKTDVQQIHPSNKASHNNWNDNQSSNSKILKNSEPQINNFRDKSSVGGAPSSKSYSYHHSSRTYSDGHLKTANDAAPYGNSEYHQKQNITYSKSTTNQSAINDNYKTVNHSSGHTGYPTKIPSYHHHSRVPSEKERNYYSNQETNDKRPNYYQNPEINDKSRSYYPSQEYNYKTYQQDSVPKQVPEESSGYKVQSENNVYPNYGASNSVKQKQTQNIEPIKQVSPDHVPNLSSESSSSIQPPVTEGNSYHPPIVSKDKTTFYPYDTPHFVPHRTTPPPSLPAPKSESSFDSLSFPSKEQDSLRYSSTSTATPQRPTTSSPITVFDNSKSSVKTLWSPPTTTAVSVAPSRELIAASSRDSHSSHSNSSISSLSQLSQSLGPGVQGSTQSTKEYSREGRSSSRSSSRNETPVCCAAPVASTNSTSTGFSSSSGSYGVSGSLTSLIFSKPSWASPSVTSVLSNSSQFSGPSSGRLGSPVPSVLPLGPSLPGSHHSSPFSPAHHVMFAPPLPPAGSLSSPSLPLAAAAGPSPFGDQDLLRRELDTRFLASQDRSINVPPPPYLRAELHQHQHQHTHMHQHSPFLPPPIGGSLLPPTAAHLYDKFPKVDAGFYGRNALSLPTYPSLSPLLAPGSATATPTPFAPPGSLAAFQPKISPLVKAKTMKPGRWCAMHVRISWEIYHHQQKQQAESQKGGSTKSVTDLLRHPNHLFGSIPRPHELGFSSPLLGSAASLHGRSPYDVAPQHPSFLSPTPAHLGMTPFARPTYPGLGVPGNSFGGLGSLAGLTGAGMLTARDLGPGYLSMAQDPWSRLHRTPPNFPSPSAMNPSSWGGLKAEAERDRLQRREEQEREKEKDKQKKAEIEKREKEAEKSKEIARESKREHEKQKERDRENRNNHIANNTETVRNGEMADRNRDREWERSRERRDSSRSPIRSTHKSEGAFDGNASTHKSDIKVKEEKKEDEHNKESSAAAVSVVSERERTKPSETSTHQEPVCDYMPRGMLPGLPTGLSSSEQARLAGSLGAMSQVPPPHFWNPLPPPPPQSAASASERYRSLELQHARELDREQLMQKYASLSSVMPMMPERYREVELARQLSSSEATAREIERQLQADRDRQAYERTKLPPPLRPNDSPFVPPAGLPPSGGLFSSLSNPFLNNLCGTNYPPRTKPGSPGGIGNGIPPPLIPCVSQGGSPVTTSTTPSPLHLKLASSSNSAAETAREHYASKERRELTSHSSEVESQSR